MAGHARLSEPERKFIVDGVRQDLRHDGRGRLDYRHLGVEGGLLPLANGSSRVTLLSGETEVLVAVKAELAPPDAAAPDRGSVECDVEAWGPGSAAAGARSVAELNTEMTAALNRCARAAGRGGRRRRRAAAATGAGFAFPRPPGR